MLWGFILPNLHSKNESQPSLLPKKGEIGDVSLQICYLILDKDSEVSGE